MECLIRVQAIHDCWISDVYGDPGRTTIKESAQVYSSEHIAEDVKFHLDILYPNRVFSVEELKPNNE